MTSDAIVETVIKVGGGGLAHPASLRATLAAVAERAHGERLVVIPGGGPFADAVREADRLVSLSADASHWMALLAMDQYAEALTSLMPRRWCFFMANPVTGQRTRPGL